MSATNAGSFDYPFNNGKESFGYSFNNVMVRESVQELLLTTCSPSPVRSSGYGCCSTVKKIPGSNAGKKLCRRDCS